MSGICRAQWHAALVGGVGKHGRVELFVVLWDTLDLVPSPLPANGAVIRPKLSPLWYWIRDRASRENRSAYRYQGRLEYEIQVIGARRP